MENELGLHFTDYWGFISLKLGWRAYVQACTYPNLPEWDEDIGYDLIHGRIRKDGEYWVANDFDLVRESTPEVDAQVREYYRKACLWVNEGKMEWFENGRGYHLVRWIGRTSVLA